MRKKIEKEKKMSEIQGVGLEPEVELGLQVISERQSTDDTDTLIRQMHNWQMAIQVGRQNI